MLAEINNCKEEQLNEQRRIFSCSNGKTKSEVRYYPQFKIISISKQVFCYCLLVCFHL